MNARIALPQSVKMRFLVEVINSDGKTIGCRKMFDIVGGQDEDGRPDPLITLRVSPTSLVPRS